MCAERRLARQLVAGALGAAVVCAGVATACTRSPAGTWRDQYVFVGDDATVSVVGVVRDSGGHAELKGWLGEGSHWQQTFYRRFALDAERAPDAERAVASFSSEPGAPARVTLDRRDGTAVLRVRTPDATMTLSSLGALDDLGHTTDPEGESLYRAGRARLVRGRARLSGTLVVEETPEARPRRSFVDYGDFVLAVLAHRERGVVVLKRSIGRPGFDHALVQSRPGSHAQSTDSVRVARRGPTLAVSLPALGVSATTDVRDRERTQGVAPDGTAVEYETLLLGGAWAGAAFTIHANPELARASEAR